MILPRLQVNTKGLCRDILLRRQCLGLSQRDLATLIGIKPQALCRLEKGEHLPKHATLEMIEQALHLPEGFYTNRRKQIEEDVCYEMSSDLQTAKIRFRVIYKNHTFDAEKLNRLILEIDRKVAAYTECEAKLELPCYDPFYLNDLQMENRVDGIIAADEFRMQLGIVFAPLYASLPLLEQRCIRLIPIDGLAPSVIPSSGKDKWRHSLPLHDLYEDNLVIAVNTTSPAQSQLYDIAYSIAAYFWYRHFELSSRTPDNADESYFCRAFAAELLSPYMALRETIGSLRLGEKDLSVGLLDAIAARFGISAMALLWTLRVHGFIKPKAFNQLKIRLENATLPDRPPLVFGSWLETLRLRAAIAR